MREKPIILIIIVLVCILTGGCTSPVEEYKGQQTPSTGSPITSQSDDVLDEPPAQPDETIAENAASEMPQPLATVETADQHEVVGGQDENDMTSGDREKAIEMQETIEALYKEGLIGTFEGKYAQLDDFDESWAQRGWFQWWSTGYAPQNFVLRGSASWDSDETDHRPEAAYSGCGVVFRATDRRAFYVIYLGLDGLAHMHVFNGEYQASMIEKRYGQGGLSDNASFMLVVEDDWFTLYVDGERILQTSAQTHGEGGLALTLLSGTNSGYGTHCNMTDLELWILEDEQATDDSIILPYEEDFESSQAGEWLVYGDGWPVMEEGDNHYWLAAASQGSPQAWLDAGQALWQDYVFESRIRFEQQGSLFICTRTGRQAESFYSAYLDSSKGYISINDYDSNVSGDEGFQVLAENKYEFDEASWYTIRFEAQGETLRLFIDDTLVLTAAGADKTQGGVGYYMEPGNTIAVDDIRILSLLP